MLHSAAGVPQRFYRHFTAWANARGLGVLTYDYRDFGDSAFRPLRESDTIFADWAVRDQALLLGFTKAHLKTLISNHMEDVSKTLKKGGKETATNKEAIVIGGDKRSTVAVPPPKGS